MGDGSRRELRLAPVMTGGTSLAVWMGGVTAELYRLVNCFDDPRPEDEAYRALLDVTATRATTDIVTGTSAGGLNGILLATAWALGSRTEAVIGLRDTWMRLGSIDAMVRSPSERNPASLLRGDDYFWPELRKVLDSLDPDPGATHADRMARRYEVDRTVDLVVTVTTVTGEPTHRHDDVGQALNETRQAHRLWFRTADFGWSADWSTRLALGARTSAAIPGVFEPSYLRVDPPGTAAAPGAAPDMSRWASFGASRWSVDGGVLVNYPLGLALDRVLRRTADGEVRRVAVYVNPTPNAPAAVVADDPAAMPSIVKVAATALTAPRNIGIAADVDRLRAHNDQAAQVVDARAGLADLLDGLASADVEVESLAAAVYPRFVELRTAASIRQLLDRLEGDERWNSATHARRSLELALGTAARRPGAWLPATLEHTGSRWPWGLAPLEFASSLLLELVCAALRLPVAGTGSLRAELGDAKARCHRIAWRVGELRAVDRNYWVARLSDDEVGTSAWAEQCYRGWPDPDAIDEPSTEASALRAWVHEELAAVAAATAELTTTVVTLAAAACESVDPDRSPPEAGRDRALIARLLRVVRPPEGATPERTVARLVSLHVFATVFGFADPFPQPVELLEISWRAPNTLDPSRSPGDKLAGTEFSRLGAFVKPSWRANDWMWGRLDAAYQLVLLVLEPTRLRQLGFTPRLVAERLGVVAAGATLPPELAAELRFLDPRTDAWTEPPPPSLPRLAAAVAHRLQRDIAAEELPLVADAVAGTVAGGGAEGDRGAFRRAASTAPRTDTGAIAADAVAPLLRACRIGEERAGAELAHDLFTRTGGSLAVVAGNAVTGSHFGPALPRRLARPIRPVALTLYAVSRAITPASRTGTAIAMATFGAAGAVLGLWILGATVPAGVAFLAGLVLLAGIAATWVRSGLVAQLPYLLPLAVVGLALLGSSTREILTTSPEGATGEAVASAGQTVEANGELVVTLRLPDGQERRETFRGGAGIEITRGGAQVVTPAPTPWKGPLFLDTVSVAAVVLAIGTVLVLGGAVRRARSNRVVALTRWLPAALVLAALTWFHAAVFELLLTGEYTGVRRWVVDRATELGDMHVLTVLAGLVVAGIVIGSGLDRVLGRRR